MSQWTSALLEPAPTMGNHLIASSGESAAPIAPGKKRDVANRGLETTASYVITACVFDVFLRQISYVFRNFFVRVYVYISRYSQVG